MFKYNQRFESPYPPEEAAKRLAEGLKGRGWMGVNAFMKKGFYGQAGSASVEIFRYDNLLLSFIFSTFFGVFRSKGEGSVLEGRFGLHRINSVLLVGLIVFYFILLEPELYFIPQILFWLVGYFGIVLFSWFLIYATGVPASKGKIVIFIEDSIGGGDSTSR